MAKGIRIIEVEPGSLASELGLGIDDRVWTLNGKRVRDALDFKFLSAGEEHLTLEVIRADGEEWELEVERDETERWGIEFEAMKPRQCGNDCLFCFIQQNPEGSRASLWVRDEDVRFSFLYGNYSTLTTISKAEVQRVIEQRLSPQYVSVHATDPELRAYLLGVDRQDDVLAKMKHFIDHGIEIHAQVVLCPTINDSQHLLKTIDDLSALHPGVVSTAVVPLGITELHKYRDRLVPVTDEYCREIIDQITPVQERLRAKLGTPFVFLGDEFYLRAGRKIPAKSHYRIVRPDESEDTSYPQIEDGVGMVRNFLEEHQQRIRKLLRLREQGNFSLKKAEEVWGTMATGRLFFPILQQVAQEMNERLGTRLQVVSVENTFFGKSITVAGLLAGRDFLNVAKAFTGRFLMIPPSCFRQHDHRFLDDLTIGELEVQLGWPVKKSWNEVFGLTLDKDEAGAVKLSHDYGAVTSFSA